MDVDALNRPAIKINSTRIKVFGIATKSGERIFDDIAEEIIFLHYEVRESYLILYPVGELIEQRVFFVEIEETGRAYIDEMIIYSEPKSLMCWDDCACDPDPNCLCSKQPARCKS